ncbi:MAG: hypothetical protein ACFE7R_08870, partial [Candidatus Hodarchaeota archaeon]
MSLKELCSRIGQSGANAAIVISIFRGNPSRLQFVNPNCESILELSIESATLRREVGISKGLRGGKINYITIHPESSGKTRLLAELLKGILVIEIVESNQPLALDSE